MTEEDSKPQMEVPDVPRLAEQLYGLHVTQVSELNSYDDRNYHLLADVTTNPRMQGVTPLGYILKVTNSADSRDVDFFEGQNQLLLWLQKKEFAAPTPVLNTSGQYFSVEELPYKTQKRGHIVRLFEFQPGKILKSVPGSLDLYYQVGVWCARFKEAVKDFRHPGIEKRSMIWNLKRAGEVLSFLDHVKDESRKKMVEEVIESFLEKVFPVMEELPQGTIHGDLNEQNILVSSQDGCRWDISSILDFGDVNSSCHLFDIAAAICYVTLEARRNGLDVLEAYARTVAGYKVHNLSWLELSLLRLTICTRLCQSLVLGLYTQSQQPDNLYIGDTQTNGWPVLQELWTTERQLHQASTRPPLPTGAVHTKGWSDLQELWTTERQLHQAST